MAETNRHGLTRRIPDPIARLVRKASGFGCVICGRAIYQYEHVDPSFADATEHDPSGITLLCGGCHDCVTRGQWSKDKVRRHMLSPKCKEMGFSFGAFDIGDQLPDVQVGPHLFRKTPVLIEMCGDPLVAFDPPEEPGGPFRLTGAFYDSVGSRVLKIDKNEWCPLVTNWDVEVVGRRITIWRSPRDIALVLRTEPPSKLVLERIHLFYNGLSLQAHEDRKGFAFGGPRATFIGTRNVQFTMATARAAIVVDNQGTPHIGG